MHEGVGGKARRCRDGSRRSHEVMHEGGGVMMSMAVAWESYKVRRRKGWKGRKAARCPRAYRSKGLERVFLRARGCAGGEGAQRDQRHCSPVRRSPGRVGVGSLAPFPFSLLRSDEAKEGFWTRRRASFLSSFLRAVFLLF